MKYDSTDTVLKFPVLITVSMTLPLRLALALFGGVKDFGRVNSF